MKNELNEALDLLEKEKNIKREIILEALQNALIHTYKKNYKDEQEDVDIRVDSKTGEIKVISKRLVVEEYSEDAEVNEILLEDAKKLKAKAAVGDIIEVEILPKNFGRIAAGTAKQIILQKIREAEREQLLHDYNISEGDIITGMVDRIERVDSRKRGDEEQAVPSKPKYNVIFKIDKAEVVMSSRGQIIGETYSHGAKFLLYIMDVNSSPKGTFIQVSRTEPQFVVKLFEREVPEIKDGIVEIKSISREPGVRSKIAVYSNDSDVEPIGACVGNRGARVNAVVEELCGEKIDIVNYSENPEEFIAAALLPAQVTQVIVNEESLENGKKEAVVTVDESQLSLAIGKAGLNAKLAARLTGWKIDIKSTSAYLQEMKENAITED
ncbi:MAG: transcription termination factor NusA [Monoglobales bacterium]